MQLKIISDGTPSGTHVVDAHTGEEVRGVKSVQWNASAESKRTECVITLTRVHVDIVGECDDLPPMPPATPAAGDATKVEQ